MGIRRTLLMLACFVALGSVVALGAAQDRIVQKVNSSVTFMDDNVNRFARAEFDRGKVASDFEMQRITLVFKLTAAQQADLNSLLQQQTDPTSANYHKWLTPAEYGKRFGLSDADYGKVTAWLNANGFKIVDTPASRTSVTFSGTAAQVEAAFRTQVHTYVVNGETHYANATPPAVPTAFANVVLGFQSLNDFKPKPRGILTRKLNPNFTSSISGSHFLTPDDVATIYNVKGLYNAGYTGSDQKIVVVGQTNVNISDITAFRTAAGLSTTNLPTLKLVPGSTDPGIVSGDIDEANLDLEWSGGIAKNATIIYVYSNNGVFDSMQYAISNNLAPVISISYGGCENSFSAAEALILRQMAQQANSLGITLVASSGDSGAAGCDYSSSAVPITSATHGLAVIIPASIPEVTAIGGTTFNESTGSYWSSTNNSNGGSALSYIPEVVWNDTVTAGDLMGTGGGKSELFTKPSWQTGTGVPADGQRDLPDISFAASPAHDPYLICSQGKCVTGFRDASNNLDTIGGTSAGTPVFAGIVALINQKMAARQGNVNSNLYSLASSTPSAFHDITTGDNKVPCTTGTTDCASGGTIGYSAGTGYDLATGLGSIDAFALATAWGSGPPPTGDFSLTPTTNIVAVTSTTPATVTITLTPLNGFSGTVVWTCSVSAALTSYASCAMMPDATTPNTKATVTIRSIRTTSKLQAPFRSSSFLFALAIIPFGLIVVRRPRTGKSRALMFGALVIALLTMVLGMAGCGGGGGTTTTIPSTPTSYSGTVIVQATSGTTSHMVAITTTVN